MNSIVVVLNIFGVPTSGFAVLNDCPVYFEADMPEDVDDWDGGAFRVYDLSGVTSSNDLQKGGRLLVDRLGLASESTTVLSDLLAVENSELLKQLLLRVTEMPPQSHTRLKFVRKKQGFFREDAWEVIVLS